ncbi:cytochrome P450 [Streptomyces smyrnaeus]|uniref:Cytochrome P450 n=1 Tax=Streptomyces smyrnaeus TaxID=1387713 RepID=A0ABS3XVR6_9ACTN|nr:cytochrome P450 [Streptomyces smyrnaeus]MBO8199497.1 cytochrome P450 [Streptomyces smyrnaeus]
METTHIYSLSDPGLIDDPYGGFGVIREEAPVARGDLGGRPVWIVTRHDDVSTVLGDRRFVNNSLSLPGSTVDARAETLVGMGVSRDRVPYLAGNLVHTDPPDHTRLRKLVTRAFSARRVKELRPRVRVLTDELLTTLPGHAGPDGTVDFIEHFAYPLPITVICELLGVPASDRPRWRSWSEDYTSADIGRMDTMLAAMSTYLRELAEQRRAEPTDDLFTALLQAHDEDNGRLSDTELITMVLTLMIAGHETTAHLLGNGLVALLTHPDQLALLRGSPELMPGAVQELLRWCSPIVVGMLRYAAEDVTVGDTLIRQGECVQVVLGSANHDPRRYPDPDRLDITRPAGAAGAHHLAYSHGPHYCLGASLANQEAEVAFTALLGTYPHLALAVPREQLDWKPLPLIRQLAHLPVTLGTPS